MSHWDEASIIFESAPSFDADVVNTYGVGKVASQCPQNRAEVSRIYSDAAQFLYGHPELKTVVNKNDPNDTVFHWIRDELNKLKCTDEEICRRFGKWRLSLNEAIRVSQRNRQFSREDWFKCLNEISEAIQ